MHLSGICKTPNVALLARVMFGAALINCERYDFPVPDAKVIIDGDRAAIKGSRYFRGDDDFRIPTGYAERLELEFVFLDCFHRPGFNGWFSLMRLSLVMNDRIIRKARNYRLHIVLIACIDILFNDFGQVDCHDASPFRNASDLLAA
jgi:hypothetical protein